MQFEVIAREQPSRARLATLTALTLGAFAAAAAATGEAACAGMTLLALGSLLTLSTDLVISWHYARGFPGRPVLLHGRDALRIWTRGRFVAVNPRAVRSWSTQGAGARRRLDLRLAADERLVLWPRIEDPDAEARALAVLEQYLGRPRRPSECIMMVPYESCA